MAITTYAGLSTAVYRQLDRTAETTVYDDCLSLTEAEINRRLALSPVRAQHTVATATLDAEYVGDPTDIMDVDSFAIDDNPILATSPQNMQAMYDGNTTTGQPRFYAQVGTQLRLFPTPDTSYTGTLVYWARVPALTSSATTNWVSLAHPDVYLTGVLAHAMRDYRYDRADIKDQFELFDLALQKMLSAYPKRADKSPRTVDLALWPRRWSYNINTGI